MLETYKQDDILQTAKICNFIYGYFCEKCKIETCPLNDIFTLPFTVITVTTKRMKFDKVTDFTKYFVQNNISLLKTVKHMAYKFEVV